MFTTVSVTASLAGMLGQGFLSQNDTDYAPFLEEPFVADVDSEVEPLRMPREEDLDRILSFALRTTLATDLAR